MDQIARDSLPTLAGAAQASKIVRESQLQDRKKFRGKVMQRVPLDLAKLGATGNLAGSKSNPFNVSFPFDSFEVIASTDSTGANNFSQYVKVTVGSRDLYNLENYRECRLGETVEFKETQLEAWIYIDTPLTGCNMTIIFYIDTVARSAAVNARISGFLSQTDGTTINTALLGSTANLSSVPLGVVGSAAVMILTSDSGRSLAELIISGGTAQFGDSAVLVGTGVPRNDGERWESRSTAALYMITTSGNPTVTGIVYKS